MPQLPADPSSVSVVFHPHNTHKAIEEGAMECSLKIEIFLLVVRERRQSCFAAVHMIASSARFPDGTWPEPSASHKVSHVGWSLMPPYFWLLCFLLVLLSSVSVTLPPARRHPRSNINEEPSQHSSLC